MAIRTIVWGENIHEQTNAVVRSIYPNGMHNTIADALNRDPAIKASTATLQEPEHGLTEARLAETDVLLWWGHKDHGAVSDDVVERVQRRASGREGLVRVGVSAGVSTWLLPLMLNALQQRSPGVEVRLEAVGSAESMQLLTAGALVIFASLAGYHLLAADLHPTSVRLAVDGSILALALGSIALRRPFTLQHAREVVDAETAQRPLFLHTNYILTWVWSAAFVLMLLADMVAIYMPSMPLWICAAIAFAIRNSAINYTQWYPKHVRAGVAASATTAAA